MPPDNWDRLESLFFSAADLPPDEQARFIEAACGNDRELLADIKSLLASDLKRGQTIVTAVGGEAALMLGTHAPVGDRLGAYRVVKEIGRGGMGAVYLAIRDDDQYRKQVAIKIVKRGTDTAEVLARFRHERQILANLDHPYIARLLDAGTTSDGLPFFVMDYVEGQPIDAYCRTQNLDVAARLRLFLRVCEAVTCAHRNLVVHRDLKPGNILVTPVGIPKLLDFGVAKLLTGGNEAAFTVTAVSVGPLTPEYASPEQVLGLPITTATDVYALGAVLYELLTGSRARTIGTATPTEIERVVCHTDVPRPRTIARHLHSDLDNILLLAMRKERERRYQSVDQLADDIRRHLEGLPVAARGDSLAYRLTKFVRRHALAVGATAVVMASIVGGAIVALDQARVAQRESALRVKERDRAEEQRQVAEREHAGAERERGVAVAERNRAEGESKEAQAQRTRAEHRLRDLVELANRSLYGLEQDLARQEGTTAARRLVVESTLGYLDKLAADESEDRELSTAVVSGYLKMGDVLGRPRKPNLGNPAGALASYRKAWALLDKMRTRQDTAESVLLWLSIGERIAVVELETVNNRASFATLNRLLPEAERLAARDPKNRQATEQLADVYQLLSDAEVARNPALGVAYGKKAIGIYEPLLRHHPGDEDLLSGISIGYSQLANTLAASGDREGAIEYARKSLDIREERLRPHPDDVLLKRDLMLSCTRVGDMLGGPFSKGNAGEEGAGYEYYKRAADLAEGTAKADPNNRSAHDDYAIVLTRLGAALAAPGAAEDSLRILERSAGMLEDSLRLNPKTRINRVTLLIAYETMARRLERLGKIEEGLGRARAEWKGATHLAAEQPDYAAARHRAMNGCSLATRLLAKLGRRDEAIDAAGQMREMASAETSASKAFFGAYAWVSLGDAHAFLALGVPDPAADWKEARSAFEHGRDEWKKLVPASGPYDAVRELTYAEARLREAEDRLR